MWVKVAVFRSIQVAYVVAADAGRPPGNLRQSRVEVLRGHPAQKWGLRRRVTESPPFCLLDQGEPRFDGGEVKSA